MWMLAVSLALAPLAVGQGEPTLVLKEVGPEEKNIFPSYNPKSSADSADKRFSASCSTAFVKTREGQGYRKGTVTLKETATANEVLNVKWEEGTFFTLAFSPNSKLLAVGGGNVFLGEEDFGEIRVWETETGKLKYHLQKVHGMVVESIAFSPDGKTLVSGGQDGVVKWWDVETGKQLNRVEVRFSARPRWAGRIFRLEFSPDGRILAIGAGSWNRGALWGEVWLWDTRAQKRHSILLEGHRQPVTAVSFVVENDKTLLIVTTAAIMKRWELSWKD